MIDNVEEYNVTMEEIPDLLAALTLYMIEQVGAQKAREILDSAKEIATMKELEMMRIDRVN